MPKPKTYRLNMNAIVQDIVERSEIATVKDIERIMKRLDTLEAKFSAIKAINGGKTKRAIPPKKKGASTGQVLAVIKKSKKGVNAETIQAKTGFDKIKVRNAISLLGKAGKIKRTSRGVYESVKEHPLPVSPEKARKTDQERPQEG
jgi:hypothetical protein